MTLTIRNRKASAIFVISQVEMASELTLAVSPNLHGDNSEVGVSKNTLAKLRLGEGDYVLARSDSFTTALRVSVGDHPDGNASLSWDARNNLYVQSGSTITLEPSPELAPIDRIAILPFADTLEGYRGTAFSDLIQPYFLRGADQQRPVTVDDLFTVATPDGMQQVQFKVIEMEIGKGSVSRGIVGPGTIIHCEGKPIEREDQPSLGRYALPTVRLQIPHYNALMKALGPLQDLRASFLLSE